MYQQITLVGRLGSDPVMRYTASGVPFASFSLAVSRSWTNQEGQRQEKTIWFRVTTWNKLAETVGQYLTKGRQVLVVGELEEPRVFTDREGTTRASLDVRGNVVRFLGSRSDNEGGGGSFGSESQDDTSSVSDEEIPF